MIVLAEVKLVPFYGACTHTPRSVPHYLRSTFTWKGQFANQQKRHRIDPWYHKEKHNETERQRQRHRKRLRESEDTKDWSIECGGVIVQWIRHLLLHVPDLSSVAGIPYGPPNTLQAVPCTRPTLDRSGFNLWHPLWYPPPACQEWFLSPEPESYPWELPGVAQN